MDPAKFQSVLRLTEEIARMTGQAATVMIEAPAEAHGSRGFMIPRKAKKPWIRNGQLEKEKGSHRLCRRPQHADKLYLREGSAVMKCFVRACSLVPLLLPTIATADISDEANACIAALTERLGNVGGEVVQQMGSQAGILVTLRTADGDEWECVVWDGPVVADLRAVSGEDAADDGGGAMAGSQPDFWQVTSGSSLNVRSEPSTSSSAFFKLPSGSVVRNLGCQESEGRTWCQVPTGPGDGASIGWVAAEFLSRATAPAGGANAMIPTDAGNSTSSNETSARVRFPAGTSGTELQDQLRPQSSKRYILGARNEQFLYFRLAANTPGMQYRIIVPSGSELMPWTDASQEYRGQLYQDGDHLFDVRNTSNSIQSYNVIFGID